MSSTRVVPRALSHVPYWDGLFFEDMKQTIMDIFEHLHANPEVSWKEYETTSFLKQKLEDLGCRTRTFSDCTGVVGEIGSGSPVVAVRADIDALWQEVNGTFRANHPADTIHI